MLRMLPSNMRLGVAETSPTTAAQDGLKRITVGSLSNYGLVDPADEIKDTQGRTGLLLAADAGHRDVVEHLLKNARYHGVQDQNGYNVLHFAAGSDHSELLQFLLQPNVLNGITPPKEVEQHAYGAYGDYAIQAMLRTENKNGNTPLHLAALGGFYSAAKVLVAAGASVEDKNHAGNIPLHNFALSCSKSSQSINKKQFVEKVIPMVKLLVGPDGDINSFLNRENAYGDTPIALCKALVQLKSPVVVAPPVPAEIALNVASAFGTPIPDNISIGAGVGSSSAVTQQPRNPSLQYTSEAASAASIGAPSAPSPAAMTKISPVAWMVEQKAKAQNRIEQEIVINAALNTAYNGAREQLTALESKIDTLQSTDSDLSREQILRDVTAQAQSIFARWFQGAEAQMSAIGVELGSQLLNTNVMLANLYTYEPMLKAQLLHIDQAKDSKELLRRNPNAYLYYKTMCEILNGIFTAAIVVRSGFVALQPADSKVTKAGNATDAVQLASATAQVAGSAAVVAGTLADFATLVPLIGGAVSLGLSLIKSACVLHGTKKAAAMLDNFLKFASSNPTLWYNFVDELVIAITKARLVQINQVQENVITSWKGKATGLWRDFIALFSTDVAQNAVEKYAAEDCGAILSMLFAKEPKGTSNITLSYAECLKKLKKIALKDGEFELVYSASQASAALSPQPLPGPMPNTPFVTPTLGGGSVVLTAMSTTLVVAASTNQHLSLEEVQQYREEIVSTCRDLAALYYRLLSLERRLPSAFPLTVSAETVAEEDISINLGNN